MKGDTDDAEDEHWDRSMVVAMMGVGGKWWWFVIIQSIKLGVLGGSSWFLGTSTRRTVTG